MTFLGQELRHAFRGLRRSPGFTAVALLTLGLGIGATTAMFSVVNGVLLRPLPYSHQERLVELVHAAPGIGAGELFASPAIYFAYRDYNRTFDAVGLWDWDDSPVTVTGFGEPEAVPSVALTHEVLNILGGRPMAGRLFSAADDQRSSSPTVVISNAYWQRHFGGAPVLGRTLTIDGTPREIIGVLAPSFTFFDYPADIYYPLQPVRSAAVFPSFNGRGIARMKGGVSLAEANADVARIIPTLTREFGTAGRGLPANAQFGPKLRLLKDSVVGDLSDTLWLLMGTIGLLFVIACANVANLVLVRAHTRRGELAIRTALGAGWAVIARVVITECVILGLVGGAIGLALAHVGLPGIIALGARDLPHSMTVKIDPLVLVVALGASLFAILIFSLIPVLQLAMRDLRVLATLRSGMRSITEGREGHRALHGLVVSQVALALVLLIGSALMGRTFYTLRHVDPGFRDPDKVQTFQINLPGSTADKGDSRLRMQQAIFDKLAAIPGVVSVGFATFNDGLPMDGDGRKMSIAPIIDGQPATDGVTRVWESQRVSPGFFETLSTPLVVGRTFTWNDVYSDQAVMLVSENLARKEWGSATAALGKRISAFTASRGSEVIGVIKDVHHEGVSQPAPETVVFRPIASDLASFVIRSDRVGTTSFMRDLRNAVWSVNPNLSLANAKTLGEMYQRSLGQTTVTLQLLAITGTMALFLGLLGIYGVVSYAVSQRRREIGIRMALGARESEVRRIFVSQALILVGIGITMGLIAAVILTRLMESQLFGVRPLDPLSYLTVALVFMSMAIIASYVPARRAARVDPLVALRYE